MESFKINNPKNKSTSGGHNPEFFYLTTVLDLRGSFFAQLVRSTDKILPYTIRMTIQFSQKKGQTMVRLRRTTNSILFLKLASYLQVFLMKLVTTVNHLVQVKFSTLL